MELVAVDRAFLRVAGEDAETYLQGQLSQDVAAGAGLSFLLDPTGKVVAFLRFARDDDGFLLDTDPEAGDAVLARLRRFLLRTKATVEPVEGLKLIRVFGGDPLPAARVAAWPADEAVQDLVGPADVVGRELLSVAAALVPVEHERRRILAGVPRSGVDIGPDTIPAEAGRWTIEQGVSFTKGCYTGQELVARIDSRGGNVPRPLRVLRFDSPVEAGAEVVADGEVVGSLTSAAGHVGLGPVARKVEVGATVASGAAEGIVER